MWRMHVRAAANDFDRTTGEGLVTGWDLDRVRIQRESRPSVDAFPEPPRPGRPLGVAGRLALADWDVGGYTGTGAEGRLVQLMYRSDADPTRHHVVADLTTGAGGAVLASTPARPDGIWWLSHPPSDSTAWGYSDPDHVDMP